jgi:hypothetical protein
MAALVQLILVGGVLVAAELLEIQGVVTQELLQPLFQLEETGAQVVQPTVVVVVLAQQKTAVMAVMAQTMLEVVAVALVPMLLLTLELITILEELADFMAVAAVVVVMVALERKAQL